MESHGWNPLEHYSPRYARCGTLQPTSRGIFKVLSPEREEVHTCELCIAPFGESHLPTHLHTYHRPTCKFWWHSGAAAVTPPPQTAGLRAPAAYPPNFLL